MLPTLPENEKKQTLFSRDFILLFCMAICNNSYMAVFYCFEQWLEGQPQLARHPALGPVRHGPALAAPGQHRAALAQQAACPAGHHLPFQLHHAGLSLHPRARQHLADPGPAHRPGHLAGGLLQLCGGRAGQLHPQGPERPGLRHLLPDHPAALFHHPGRGRTDPAPAGR